MAHIEIVPNVGEINNPIEWASPKDYIQDGEDLEFLKRLELTLTLQKRMAYLYDIGAQMEEITKFSTKNINSILEKINNNFNILQKHIIDNNLNINRSKYGQFFEAQVFFKENDTIVDIKINETNIEITNNNNTLIIEPLKEGAFNVT